MEMLNNNIERIHIQTNFSFLLLSSLYFFDYAGLKRPRGINSVKIENKNEVWEGKGRTLDV